MLIQVIIYVANMDNLTIPNNKIAKNVLLNRFGLNHNVETDAL